MEHYMFVKDIHLIEKNENKRTSFAITPDGSLKTYTKHNTRLTQFKLIYLLKTIFEEVFLPEGYPSSVSSDYWDYQIWDTVQAFCSTVSTTLTTHAIFKGIGVGDSNATALAATITWIMKDGTGMIGRIVFAWWKGYVLDTDCKKWRLVADTINDAAMLVELLLGMAFFKKHSLILLCCSTTMKAIVGVAGGATRAAIMQHQAIRNNMADVSAKDGSQETCVNLVASCFGVFLLTNIENNVSIVWILFFFITALHMFANYKAVKSLKIRTLNASRLVLLMKYFLQFHEICSVDKINYEESVVLGCGATDYELCSKKIFMGCSFNKIVEKQRDSFNREKLTLIRNVYEKMPYFILHDHESMYVMLHENITDQAVVKGWFHAVILGIVLRYAQDTQQTPLIYYNRKFHRFIEDCNEETSASRVNDFVESEWKTFLSDLSANGWIVNQHQLVVGDYRVKWVQ